MVSNKNLIGISGRISSGKDLIAKMIQFLTIVPPSKRDIGVYQGGTWDIHDIGSYQIHRFADKLKQIVSLLTGIPREDLEKEEVKSSELSKEWNTYCVDQDVRLQEPVKPMTVRTMLQLIGTNALRDQVHHNIHVNGLFADYKSNKSTIDWNKMRLDRGWVPPYCINCKAFIEITGQFVCDNCLKSHYIHPKWIISDLRFVNEFEAIKERDGILIRIERKYDLSDPKFKHASETGLDWYVEHDKFDYVIQNNGTIEDLLESVKLILTKEEII